MRARCTNPKVRAYNDYGGRGIKVCKRWQQSFENFLADMGECPTGKSLDRINNSGNYTPKNCKWSTPKEQSNNRRPRSHQNRNAFQYDLNGTSRTLLEWGLEYGIKPATLWARMSRGLTFQQALDKPLRPWRL